MSLTSNQLSAVRPSTTMAMSRTSRMCLFLGLLARGAALSVPSPLSPRLCTHATRRSVGFSHYQKPKALLVGKHSAVLTPVNDPPPTFKLSYAAAGIALLLLAVMIAVLADQRDMLAGITAVQADQRDMLAGITAVQAEQSDKLSSLSTKFDNVGYFVAGIVALTAFGGSVVKILEYLDRKAAEKAMKGLM